MEAKKDVIIKTENLSVHFPVKGSNPFNRKYVKAVSDVSLEIRRGETFGLVGESGCGKSTFASALLGMLKPTDGKVIFEEQDLNALPKKKFKELRRNMQMIFQDPFSSLNPRFDLLEIIGEPMVIRGGYTAQEIEDRVVEMLELVGLSRQDLHRYPSDFSGGQRQRIGIARAIILNPSFLVCDEPVSALDVSVHAQILNLLTDIQKKSGITYLFISHNLAVVKSICDHMAVMYLGKVMECGSTQKIYNNTLHPYTKALLSAVLDIDVDNPRERIILQGDIPSPISPPAGCRFCQRCPNATAICYKVAPKLVEIEPDHMIACHLYPECKPE
jgi:oligopeptide/dipeptide ABC transporter ATP-binding protein